MAATGKSAAPLRLLCLHGMHQNKTTFAKKTAHIAQHLDGFVEMIYIDGPVVSHPKILKSGKATTRVPVLSHDFRSWWAQGEQNKIVDALSNQLAQCGPIDGVVGFSQGAAVASLLCSNTVTQQLGWTPRLAIFFNGYMESEHSNIHNSGISSEVRSLHVFSRNDRVVPVEKSLMLAQAFQPNTRYIQEHTQGHIVSTEEDVTKAVHSFARQFLIEADNTRQQQVESIV